MSAEARRIKVEATLGHSARVKENNTCLALATTRFGQSKAGNVFTQQSFRLIRSSGQK